MLGDQIIERIKDYIDEDGAAGYDLNRLKREAFAAAKHVQNLIEKVDAFYFLIDEVDIVVDGQQTVIDFSAAPLDTLPKIRRIKHLRRKDGNLDIKFEYVDFRLINGTVTGLQTLFPSRYKRRYVFTLKRNSIEYAIPIGENHTVGLSYAYQITDLADYSTDSWGDIPDSVQDLIPLRAAIVILAQERNSSKDLTDLYIEQRNELLATLSKRSDTEPRYVNYEKY